MQQRGNNLCLSDSMFPLQTIITEENPFALAFKNMAEVEDEEICRAALEGRSVSVVKMSLLEGHDRRRYNLPSHNEVAVVFVGDDGAAPSSRGDAVLNNQLVHNPERATLVRNHVTLSQYYNYKLSVRQFFYSLFNGKKPFQQYAVDVPGRVVVLPSTYVGSPRALKENFEDAMAISKKYGKPDLFITFTCNSKWREITENLYPGQTANNRPDLVIRHGILGKVVTHVQIIEFQNRGLPHVHILLHFANDDKLETAYDINNLISAEIPDPIVNRDLYDVVKTCMIHGPCGILNPNSPCMKDEVCSKNYPKEFNVNTVAVQNGYLCYRRRDNGLVINIKGNNVDNRWVIPYNPWLSKKYQAHINVKACTSVKAVKYLYKYIYKGHDCANILINCRYVSAPEALWRIFKYPVSHISHTIIRLKVHLPENQLVYFREGAEQMALDRAAQRDTHLTEWFKLNTENERAHCYSYVDILYQFIFDDKHFKWKFLLVLASVIYFITLDNFMEEMRGIVSGRSITGRAVF
ncbi:uncharacterized protein LOC136079369 [Hydra vulgaris]|uniref:Uncharacterized protein LOC136079369 n=1 Tax=Hydra vulgaris TaxID=6087 RepID=A0ABM4BPY0_HYDVU